MYMRACVNQVLIPAIDELRSPVRPHKWSELGHGFGHIVTIGRGRTNGFS